MIPSIHGGKVKLPWEKKVNPFFILPKYRQTFSKLAPTLGYSQTHETPPSPSLFLQETRSGT